MDGFSATQRTLVTIVPVTVTACFAYSHVRRMSISERLLEPNWKYVENVVLISGNRRRDSEVTRDFKLSREKWVLETALEK